MKFIKHILIIVLLTASTAHAETLLELQRELVRNNPEILAAKNRYLAATKVPIQEGTLPDPMISFTDFGVGRPFFTALNESDFAYRGFGISQDLPFPGKLNLRSQIANKKAEAAEQELRLTTIRLLSQLKTEFVEYAYLQQAIAITEKYRVLVNHFTEISEAKYKVGEGVQSDILRAQLERSTLEEKMQLLYQDLESRRAAMNALLNRAIDGDLKTDETFLTPQFDVALEVLRKRLEERSPEILSKIVQQEQRALELKLANKEKYPDFSATFQWQKTGSEFPDYYMTMFEARIPLYYWRKQKPAIAQATLELQASKNEKEATLKKLNADLKAAYISATTTANLAKLYNEGIIPQSRISLESTLSAYQVGKVDFLTLLNSGTTLLNYESEFLRRVADHEKAVARIEEITGQLITPTGIELTTELGL
ncbi:TolC family protein [bacterium]|nr:TolC family protein [bacterium]MCI0601560.1 TolC family protein [bacterium]